MTTTTPGTTGAGAAERVRVLLEEQVLDGTLAPGSRVNADEVARRVGVSHIPVREALRALEADGWVVHRPHQGAFVRTRDAAELVDLFEARALVEPEAAGLAAARRSSADLEALQEVVRRQSAVDGPGSLARVNYDFHVALAAAAHNSTLLAVVADMSKRVRFYYLPTATSRREDSLHEHRAMVDMVGRRDVEAVRDLARRHISRTGDQACAAVTGPRA